MLLGGDFRPGVVVVSGRAAGPAASPTALRFESCASGWVIPEGPVAPERFQCLAVWVNLFRVVELKGVAELFAAANILASKLVP